MISSGTVRMSQEQQESVTEQEPDYRFTLANERTFLAWIRTALALLAVAVAVAQLLPNLGVPHIRLLIAIFLAVLSIIMVVGSTFRWWHVQMTMRREGSLPRTIMPWLLATGLVIVILLLMAMVLLAYSG